MLGECNTCVMLQYRATSSGTTVDGLVCLFFIFVVVVAVVVFFMGDGLVPKIGFFTRDGGMGVGALTEKYPGIFFLGGGGELGSLISAGQSHKRCKVATCECGQNLMGGYWN